MPFLSRLSEMSIIYWPLHSRVTAFTTTRPKGYSKGEYGQFNINPWGGDDPDAVLRNRQLLCQTLELHDIDHIILPHQVHDTKCFQVKREFFSLSEETRKTALEGIDIVMTDVTCVSVGVSTADCVPILLYDFKHHTACAIHAGWRGCVQRAIPKAIQAMRKAYESRPEEMKALIGPHISMHRYPVGADVLEEFAKAGFDIEKYTKATNLWDQQHLDIPEENRRWDLDLNSICKSELRDAGIQSRQILNADSCTFDNPDLYFSARRQGIACGRNYTGIILHHLMPR